MIPGPGTLTRGQDTMKGWRAGRCLRGLLVLFVGIGAAISGPGCGGGGRPNLVPVAGQVTLDGRPLTSGQVVFHPDAARGNNSLDEPRGPIDAQGRYELSTVGQKGVVPGWYKVAVIATEPFDPQHPYVLPKSLIPVRYNDPSASGLTHEVRTNAAPGAYDLKLAE
jgi:hypothetical protein